MSPLQPKDRPKQSHCNVLLYRRQIWAGGLRKQQGILGTDCIDQAFKLYLP